MLRMMREAKRPQRSGASTRTGRRQSHVGATGFISGSVRGAPVTACRSRAMPIRESASPRFGVNFTSMRASLSLAYSRMSVPTGASSGRSQMPVWSSVMPSSRAEQSIPIETTPRSFDFLILKPPGSSAPTRAQGAFTPALTFGAPQTICRSSPVPASTSQTCRWSEFS